MRGSASGASRFRCRCRASTPARRSCSFLGGPDDSLIGNVIKQQFLETRDWPFGSVLSIVLTVVALGIAGLAAWIGSRGTRREAADA